MDLADLLLETLRFRQAPPTTLNESWAAVSTAGLARLIAYEDCALWLSRRLRQIGAVTARDPEFSRWLERRARDEAARNLLVDAETEKIARFLEAEGVPSVFIKGAARRATTDRYPWADARRSNDVDVLVPASRVRHAWDRLRSAGYELVTDPNLTPPDHYHPPPLFDRSHVAVELHSSTSNEVPADEAWRRANDGALNVVRSGLTLRVPSATELLWHGITHGLQQVNPYRLRFFFDVAVVMASGADVSWDVIATRLASPEVAEQRNARAWLGTAVWLANPAVPAPDLTEGVAPFDLRRALRWRRAVLRRRPADSRFGEKLLTESVRIETGHGPTPPPHAPMYALLRYDLAVRAARTTYRAWRAADALVT